MTDEQTIRKALGSFFDDYPPGIRKVRGLAALDRLVARLAEAEKAPREITALVDQQAEDEGLWGIHLSGQQPIAEAYLQQELRRLHAQVEALSPDAPEGAPELRSDGAA